MIGGDGGTAFTEAPSHGSTAFNESSYVAEGRLTISPLADSGTQVSPIPLAVPGVWLVSMSLKNTVCASERLSLSLLSPSPEPPTNGQEPSRPHVETWERLAEVCCPLFILNLVGLCTLYKYIICWHQAALTTCISESLHLTAQKSCLSTG